MNKNTPNLVHITFSRQDGRWQLELFVATWVMDDIQNDGLDTLPPIVTILPSWHLDGSGHPDRLTGEMNLKFVVDPKKIT